MHILGQKVFLIILNCLPKVIHQRKNLKYFSKFKDKIPPEIFNEIYQPPRTDDKENGLRKNLRTARRILKDEGWTIQK